MSEECTDVGGFFGLSTNIRDRSRHLCGAESSDVALALGGGRLGIGLAAGAEVVAPPADQPWGERVAEVRDPDGNLLYLAAEA